MPFFIPDFTKLWDTTYLFGPAAFEPTRSDTVFLWAAIAFVVIGLAVKLFNLSQEADSPKKFLLNRYFHLFLTMGILLLIWSGAREQGIPWISTHFLVLVLFVIWLVWLIFIVKYHFRKHRKLAAAYEEDKLKRKYLAK